MAKKKNPAAVELGRHAKARMKKLTPEKRSEVARTVAAARPGKPAAGPKVRRKRARRKRRRRGSEMGMSHAPLQYTPARWMQFVDGENLTIRVQELLKESGAVPLIESARYRKDCFLWPGNNIRALGVPQFAEPLPIRSFYYTSVVGDDSVIQRVRGQLWEIGFEPHVFEKAKQTQKAKGVDIALTKDMLSHAFRGNYEVAELIAGDGDYVPLVEEVKRLGKRVEVCFIERCTNPSLKLASDRFTDIANIVTGWAQVRPATLE